MLPRTLHTTGLMAMLALAVCAQSSQAATLQDGLAALNAEQYPEAVSILRPLADSGDPQAQFLIAAMYTDGKGLPRNPQAGCDWYEKAAEQAYPPALLITAMCYREGVAGSVNYDKTAFWLKKGVEKGVIASKCLLGELFMKGTGVEKNTETAFELCRQGATAGDVSAQTNLGQFYLLGIGTEKNIAKGVEWMERAARAGDAAAQYNFAQLLANGQGVAQDQKKAEIFFKASGDQGFGPAQLSIGKALLLSAINQEGNRDDSNKAANAYIWLILAQRHTNNPAEREEAKRLTDKLRADMPAEIQAAVDKVINEWRPTPPQAIN